MKHYYVHIPGLFFSPSPKELLFCIHSCNMLLCCLYKSTSIDSITPKFNQFDIRTTMSPFSLIHFTTYQTGHRQTLPLYQIPMPNK